MKSLQAKKLTMPCVMIAVMLLLEGCATSAEQDEITEEPTVAAEIRCPAGYTKVCEAKKVGRIRFGRIGSGNIDSCACEPESTGRPAQPVIPSIP